MRFLIFVLLFLGCSNKDIFIPKDTKPFLSKPKTTKTLADYTKEALTFKDLELVYVKKRSFIDTGIKGEWRYFDENGTNLGEFERFDKEILINANKIKLNGRSINFKHLIYSAKRKNNLLAVVFENNAIGLYDLDIDKLVFYKEFKEALGVKYLAQAPIFYDNVIFYPLLDGRVAIVKDKKFINNIVVSDGVVNNNIIFLKIIDDTLYIATPNRLIIFNPNYFINYDAQIKHIIYKKPYFYLFLVGGEIIKLDKNLKEIAKKRLDFASFYYPSICKGNIYTIARGYLIKITPQMDITVYRGLNIGEITRIKGCKIYTDNKVYKIE